MEISDEVMLYWTFENDHIYHKSFNHVYEAIEFTNRCGLVSHPYITTVQYKYKGFTKFLKGE